MSKNDKVVVVEVAGEVITPEQAAAKAALLRSIVIDSIQPAQVRDMMRALMARAGNGEHRAINTVLQLVGAGQPEQRPPAPANVMQVNVDQAENVMLHPGQQRAAIGGGHPAPPPDRARLIDVRDAPAPEAKPARSAGPKAKKRPV